jgi:hypothetical protein
MRDFFRFLHSFLLLFMLLSLSFGANVYVHELGHYMAADAFSLDPTLHVLNPFEGSVTAFAVMEPVAYVRFQVASSHWQTFTVAIAGVMWNIILALLITYLYLHTKRTSENTTFYLALLLPCILSVFLNLNIFSPISDGSLIAQIVSEMLK